MSSQNMEVGHILASMQYQIIGGMTMSSLRTPRLKSLLTRSLFLGFANFFLAGGVLAQWSSWEPVEGITIEAHPSCVIWGLKNLDCFVRGTDDFLWHNWLEGDRWHGWEFRGAGGSEGEKIKGPPSCVTLGANRFYCFARGFADYVWGRKYNGSTWDAWTRVSNKPMQLTEGSPSCVGRGTDRIDCFVHGPDNHMWHGWMGDGHWTNFWKSRDGVLTEQPSCVARDANRVDCFARGTNKALFHSWLVGSQWNGWQLLGGGLAIEGPPFCLKTWGNRIDCFARGSNDHMWHGWLVGDQWNDWQSRDGQLLERPSCVSRGQNQLNCFARIKGAGGAVWHTWLDGGEWKWEPLGGDFIIQEQPTCVSWGPNRIDCLARGPDKVMCHLWWPKRAPTSPPPPPPECPPNQKCQ